MFSPRRSGVVVVSDVVVDEVLLYILGTEKALCALRCECSFSGKQNRGYIERVSQNLGACSECRMNAGVCQTGAVTIMIPCMGSVVCKL